MTVFAVVWWYILIGWALLEIGLRSWARPERLDGSWAWTWPADSVSVVPIGPRRPLPAGPVAGGGWIEHGTVELDERAPFVLEPVHVGATEDWSPKHAAAEAAEAMLPLDDVDEWLAARLSEYGAALVRIDNATRGDDGEVDGFGVTLERDLQEFGDRARMSHYFRMIEVATGNYGPREHMQLEALLSA